MFGPGRAYAARGAGGRRTISSSASVHAVARITAVLQRSLILDDLCATHHLLCASRAPCPVAAFHGRSRTVHIASFRAGHGDAASNYYHFFFGLLVPFLNWLETSRPLQGDAFLLNEHGVKHKFLPQLMRLAGREKCVQVGVVGASTRNGSDATARHVTLSNDLDWSILEGPSPRRMRPPEWGLDWHLYGCGFFSIEARRELAQRVDVASRTMLRACACAPEPLVPSKPRLLFVRRRADPRNRHQNRSLPNFDALVAHLHAPHALDLGGGDRGPYSESGNQSSRYHSLFFIIFTTKNSPCGLSGRSTFSIF